MPKTALVTGANQGLGLALVRALANRMAADDTVYLAARSEERGLEAVSEMGATRAQLRFLKLDVTNPIVIQAAVDHLKSAHGSIDIVASNATARISKDRTQSQQVRGFVETNNHGSCNLFEALRPLINANA